MKRSIQIGRRTYEVTSDDIYLANMSAMFEPSMVALFQSLIEPGMVVADIGANIGMTSLLFSDLAEKVYAFEPSPSTFTLLVQNLQAAEATNVEPLNIGLGEAGQNLTLTFASDNRSGGFVSRYVQPEAGHTTENIKIETLDSVFFDNRPRPDFIKIDAEGFEPHVIQGGKTLIAAQKPVVVLELNHFCLNVLQRVTLPDFFDLLRSVFPVLLAVDADNRAIVDLHRPDFAYSVMHGHVTQFRYPNIVGAFDPKVVRTLEMLRQTAAKA